MRNAILTFIILFSGCSILPSDYLTDLPDKFEMTRIDFVTETELGAKKYFSANVKYLNNSIEVDFIEPINIFYQSASVDKIYYYLNNKNFVDSIILVQTNNIRIKDRFIYNSNNALSEMSNSFFNDNLKIFYKNNVMDSVYKTQLVTGGATLTGFFKKVSSGIVSIFPYNKMQSHSLSKPTTCEVIEANVVNKSFFNLDAYNESKYLGFTCAGYNGVENVRTNGQFTRNTTLNYNGDVQEVSIEYYHLNCWPLNYGLSYYLLIPEILPIESDFEVLTQEREIRARLKSYTSTPLQKITMKYIYKPL